MRIDKPLSITITLFIFVSSFFILWLAPYYFGLLTLYLDTTCFSGDVHVIPPIDIPSKIAVWFLGFFMLFLFLGILFLAMLGLILLFKKICNSIYCKLPEIHTPKIHTKKQKTKTSNGHMSIIDEQQGRLSLIKRRIIR